MFGSRFLGCKSGMGERGRTRDGVALALKEELISFVARIKRKRFVRVKTGRRQGLNFERNLQTVWKVSVQMKG